MNTKSIAKSPQIAGLLGGAIFTTIIALVSRSRVLNFNCPPGTIDYWPRYWPRLFEIR